MKPPKTDTAAAFTLIELLVTIGIVATLIALIVPAVRGGLDQAKIAETVSNLRQVGVLMNRYADENNNRYPAGEDTSKSGGERYWIRRLVDQTGVDRGGEAHKLFNAPIAPKQPILQDSEYISSAFTGNVAILGTLPNAEGYSTAKSRVQLDYPSRTILALTGEQSLWSNATNSFFYRPWPFTGTKPVDARLPVTEGPGGIGYYVRGKAAVLMASGHVELIEKGEITWGNIQGY